MDSKLQLIFAAKNLASGEMGRLHGGLLKLRHGAVGLGTGLHKAAGGVGELGKKAAFALGGGILALAGALTYATKQAADEDVGIRRLSAALKANIPHWKGNTAAIEARIAAQEKLGFSDNEQRDSLARLVAKFHDVALAQKIQTAAMDVARLKGIDLATASDLVGKGLDGNAKALKQFGIELPKTATKAQRLAAIQKAAAGQAEIYGKSSQGAFASFKIALDDLVEDAGRFFLPVMTTVFTFLRETAIPAVRTVMASVVAWVSANQPLIRQIGDFARGALTTLFNVIGFVVNAVAGKGSGGGPSFIDAVVALGSKIFNFVVPKVVAFVTTLTKKGGVIDSIAGVVGPIIRDLLPAFGNIATALFGGKGSKGLIPILGDLAGALWGDGKSPVAMAVKFIGGALKVALDVVAIVIDKIGQAIELAQKLAGLMGKSPGAQKFSDWFQAKYGRAPSPVDYASYQNGGFPGAPRARGGPVWPGGLFRVGENGSRESWMTADGYGRVIPDGGAAARARGGGGGQRIIQLVVDKRVLAQVIDDDDYWTNAAGAGYSTAGA